MTAKTNRPVGRPPKLETLVARAVSQAIKKEAAPARGTNKRAVKARYDAAGQGRRMASWNPARTSPNTAIQGVERIRERARDSSRNDWSAAALVQKWSTSLVGIGITPRWKKIKAKAKKEQIVKLFLKWARKADADGVLDIFGMQTMVVRTWFDGGECFARKRRRFPDSGLPVPLQVQLLEADMCPMLDSTARKGLPEGHEIKSGIEFDKRGQRVAYWFYKNHPGDRMITYNGEELVRVAASEVCHIFEPKRPGQIRGVSEAAPILARLRNTVDLEDATLERQKLANLFVAFVKKTMPDFDPYADDRDPLTGKEIEEDDYVPPAPINGMQPGAVQVLDEGESMEFANPPEAGTTYSDYVRTMQLGTSAGGGLPYELMSGDILNISDRALRITMNEFRRFAEQRQWQIVIPMFCQPVIDWFAEAAVVAGLIAESDFEAATDVEHSPHGWPDIHPTQDIEGRILAVDAGFRSQSSVISARGDDPDAVAEEQAEDDARNQRLKIGPYSKAKAMEAASKTAAPPKKEEESVAA
jgi:lambda family phage portal protein